MNSVKLKNQWFGIPDDGIGYDNNALLLTVIADGTSVDDMERLLNPVPEIIEIYDENRETKTGEFVGYINVKMIAKNKKQLIYGTGTKDDTITVQFAKPDIEEKIEATEAQMFYTAMMTDTLLEEEE